MSERVFKRDTDVALVGEIDVRRELAAEGWLTINTNTEKGNFPNVDLIAARGDEARAIQVKTTDAEKGSHKHCLFMGRGEGWLTNRTAFFNAKPGPLAASIVILVHAKRDRSRFVVLPVALAESIARQHVEQWYVVPKRDGLQRSPGFDARIPFTRLSAEPRESERQLNEVLIRYEDRWDILELPVDELKDMNRWGIS